MEKSQLEDEMKNKEKVIKEKETALKEAVNEQIEVSFF